MTESASGNATEYFRIQGISSGAVFTHFKSQPSGVSTWDGSCGTVIAQLIFEKRERRSSARNRERHEAKAREMKIERTASAAAGSARHNTPVSPHAESLARPRPRPGGGSELAGRRAGRGSAPLAGRSTASSGSRETKRRPAATQRGRDSGVRREGPTSPRRDSSLPGHGRREGAARAPCGHAPGREREERPTLLPRPRLRPLGPA